MSVAQKIKSELLEISVFLLVATLLGTWMTLTHSVRDLNALITYQQEEVTELTQLRHSLEKNHAHQANIGYIDERLFIEGTRFNAHVTYYNHVLDRPLYRTFRKMLPVKSWETVDLSTYPKVEILSL